MVRRSDRYYYHPDQGLSRASPRRQDPHLIVGGLMTKLRIVQTVISESFCYPIYDWEDSKTEWLLIGPQSILLAERWDCFRFPVRYLALPDFDHCRLLSHVAVRTDAYPLLWMWAWFIEKAKSIARHDFWLMMRIAYSVGLARQTTGMYPSWSDFLFWPKRGRQDR